MKMMMMMDLLMLTIIVVFVVDLSGAVDSFKMGIWRMRKGLLPYRDIPLKPLDCSLCMTFWTGVIYLIATGNWSLYGLLIVVIMAYMSEVIGNVMVLLKESLKLLLARVENALFK